MGRGAVERPSPGSGAVRPYDCEQVHEEVVQVVAFGLSIIVTLLMVGGALWYGQRRPVGTPLTWGEAMVGAVYVFFALFWVYGIVPHLWLTWADSELRWRPDKFLYGPGSILKPTARGGHFPITLTYQTVRDIIATGIYGVALGANGALFVLWQKRGAKKPATAVARSEYGRPLVKEGV
jgi:hypothetical protein